MRHKAEEAPLLLVRLNHEAQRKYYVAHLPWWRHPLVGYITSLPLNALALVVPFAMKHLMLQDYFLGAPLFLVIVIIALIWGAGPAICSIIIGTVALDYLFVPPYDTLNLKDGREMLPLLPFLLAEVIIALITAQRESARRRAFVAEQDMLLHAEDLEQTNRRLEELNRLKNQFVSMASHELKTPLTSIRGHAQVAIRRLKKQKSLPPELQSIYTSLEKIDAQTHRLHILIEDLLDISAIQAGKMQMRLKRCDLNALCDEIVSDQRMLSGRTIELDMQEKANILRIDRERMGQVIANLLTNAIKYSPEESVVKVIVTKQPGGTRIEVHNEGEPIPAQQQEHLFELFYRADNAQDSNKQGWGLGLAISKDIIERHGGQIRLHSSEGEGTSFFVELPATVAAV